MATIVKMYVEVPAAVLEQSERVRQGFQFAADSKDFLVAQKEVDGLLPLREAVYATAALKLNATNHNSEIKDKITRNEAEFGLARKFVAERLIAEKTAKRANAIWEAIAKGDALAKAAAAEAAKTAKTA